MELGMEKSRCGTATLRPPRPRPRTHAPLRPRKCRRSEYAHDMSPLCRYRASLGRPGEGVHAPRLLGLAAVDVIGTVVIAAMVARWRRWPVARTIAAAFAAAVVIHRAFCVDTALNVALLGRVR